MNDNTNNAERVINSPAPLPGLPGLATSVASEFHSAAPTSIQPNVRKCPPLSDLGESSQLDLFSLNDQQRVALRLLVIGKPLSAIARQLAIDVRTLHRWRQNETFRRELGRLRRQLWNEAVDRLRSLVHPSLDVLEQNLRDRYDRSRFRAANTVLRHANLRKCVPLEDHPGDGTDDCEDFPAD